MIYSTAERKKSLLACLAVGVSLLVGVCDYFVRIDMAFSIFYVPAILLLTWSCGQLAGYGLATLCALLWLVADVSPVRFSHELVSVLDLWNGFVRLILFALLVFLLSAVRRRQDELQHQVQEQANVLVVEVFRRENAERELAENGRLHERRLSQELHDGLGAEIAGLKIHANILAESLHRVDSPQARQADQLLLHLGNAADQFRNLIRSMFRESIADSRVCNSLSALAEQAESLFQIECRVIVPACIDEAEPGSCDVCCKTIRSGGAEVGRVESFLSLRHEVYRIAQEAIRNAVVHGQASRIDLQVEVRDGNFLLEIRDNGRGFSSIDTFGIGLRSMQLRATALGGALQIDSKPNGGCTVRCSVPLRLQGQSST